MVKTRNAILLIVAVILVSGITTAAYFKTAAPATSSSLKTSSSLPASVNPSVSRSTYMSNQTIRSILDQAYEQHRWGARQQALLNTLNARYDRRIDMPR